MKNVRVWFSKTGTARYISHLDLNRCMSRAFHKAKLPLWYTEGYNPHVFLTFAAPLSLGFDGPHESMDIRLVEDMDSAELIEKLNAGLPPDIRVYEIAEPEMKANDIAFAEYEISLKSEQPLADIEALSAFLALPSIPVQKHTKKGDKTIDIKPFFLSMTFETAGQSVRMCVRLPAGNQGGINPMLFFEAAERALSRSFFVRVARTALFDAKMRVFR